jgi:hypothetical protein
MDRLLEVYKKVTAAVNELYEVESTVPEQLKKLTAGYPSKVYSSCYPGISVAVTLTDVSIDIDYTRHRDPEEWGPISIGTIAEITLDNCNALNLTKLKALLEHLENTEYQAHMERNEFNYYCESLDDTLTSGTEQEAQAQLEHLLTLTGDKVCYLQDWAPTERYPELVSKYLLFARLQQQ